MLCKKCGKELNESDSVCSSCGEAVTKDETLVETVETKEEINEVVEVDNEESNEEVETVVENKVVKEAVKPTKKTKFKTIVITGLNWIVALSILVFMILMFFDWYSYGGMASYKGFAEITESIMPSEADEDSSYIDESHQETYVTTSPISLVRHVVDHWDDYKEVVNTEAETKTSVFSILNMVYIILFIAVIILGVVSILILLLSKEVNGIHFVKISSFVTIGVLAMNYLVAKVTYLSMIAINAQTNLIVENGYSEVGMNKDGLLIDDTTYLYFFDLEPAFFKALICLGVWALLSAILGEVKRNRDQKAEDEAIINEINNSKEKMTNIS